MAFDLSNEERQLLREVAAYFEVWAKWSRDPVLVEQASKFRRSTSAVKHRRFQKLKNQGFIEKDGERILGGGVAFPLTTKGREAISVEESKRPLLRLVK